LDTLTILIGENDVGKTVILDAIELLLGPGNCKETDFREISDKENAKEIVIEGLFQVDAKDSVPHEFTSENGNVFKLVKRFGARGTTFEFDGFGYDDKRFDDFESLRALQQKDLLQNYGVRPGSNTRARVEQLEELVQNGRLRRIPKPITVAYSSIQSFLPRVERVSSSSFTDPSNLIRSTLRTVAQSVLKPIDNSTGQSIEDKRLRAVRHDIEKALNSEIEKAKESLQRIHPALKSISIDPAIDFSNVVSSVNLRLDLGTGERYLSLFGEGTRRRMWLGLLDWQREVERSSHSGHVIRLYDEPDINLHYGAQRRLFEHIASRSLDKGARTQSVICTHSIHLIDRAPAQTIRHIYINNDGSRAVKKIEGSQETEIQTFLKDIGLALGLSNTALLYEKGFLLVEGEAEHEAVPIIYRTLFGRSMAEDGLLIVNLFTCSAWKSALQVLFGNRIDFLHLLLDNDCQAESSSAKITPSRLKEAGCPPEFMTRQITFIGEKEFEDAFSDELIARALNAHFPREDDNAWIPEQVAKLRDCPKFSEALQKLVHQNCQPQLRNNAKKIEISVAIAQEITTAADVPSSLIDALDALRKRAGITN